MSIEGGGEQQEEDLSSEIENNPITAAINERAKTASDKVKQKVVEGFLPRHIQMGKMGQRWLGGIMNDFYHLARNPSDPSGGGQYEGWSRSEIEELYKVLYDEELE